MKTWCWSHSQELCVIAILFFNRLLLFCFCRPPLCLGHPFFGHGGVGGYSYPLDPRCNSENVFSLSLNKLFRQVLF